MSEVSENVKKQILDAVSQSNHGATITEIERNTDFERHTISKYLFALKREGFLELKIAGKAKLWFINKAPFQAIAKATPASRSFIENTLLTLLSSIPLGVIVIDRDYTIQFMNTRANDIYGAVLGGKLYTDVFGLDNPLGLKEITSIIDYSTVTLGSMQLVDKYFSTLEINASKLINPDGSLSVVLLVRDITEQIQSEEQIKKLARVVEQTADMVLITDRDGIIEYVNPAFEKETGYTLTEVKGEKPSVLKSGKHTKRFYETMWRTVLSGKPYTNTVIDKKKDGTLLYEQKTITPLFEGKKITHFVSTGKVIDGKQK